MKQSWRKQDRSGVVLDLIISALEDLSNIEYQRRVWLGKSSNEISSLIEVSTMLFEDSNLEEALSRAKMKENSCVFSREIDKELETFSLEISKWLEMETKQGTEKIIEDPNWRRVLDKSSYLVTKLNEIKIEILE